MSTLRGIIRTALSGTVGKIVKPVASLVSPAVRDFICEMWVRMKDITDRTTNEADDIITYVFRLIMDFSDYEIRAAQDRIDGRPEEQEVTEENKEPSDKVM